MSTNTDQGATGLDPAATAAHYMTRDRLRVIAPDWPGHRQGEPLDRITATRAGTTPTGLPFWLWDKVPAALADDPAVTVVTTLPAEPGKRRPTVLAWTADVEADPDGFAALAPAAPARPRRTPAPTIPTDPAAWRDRLATLARLNARPTDPTASVRGYWGDVVTRTASTDDGETTYEIPVSGGVPGPWAYLARGVVPDQPVGWNVYEPETETAAGIVPGHWEHRPISQRESRNSRERAVWCRTCGAVASSRTQVQHRPIPLRAGPAWHLNARPGRAVPCPSTGSTDPAAYAGLDLPGVISGPDTMSAPVTIRRETVRRMAWRFDPLDVGRVTKDGDGWTVGDGWSRVRVTRREWRTYSRSIRQAQHGVPTLRVPDQTPRLQGGEAASTFGRSRIVQPDGTVGRRVVGRKIRQAFLPWPGLARHMAPLLDGLADLDGFPQPLGQLARVLPTRRTLNADGSIPAPRKRRSRAAIVAATKGKAKAKPPRPETPDVTTASPEDWDRYRQARADLAAGKIG